MKSLSARVKENGDYTDIFMSDGGLASLYHNGEHIVTTYYQERVDDAENNDEVWDIVAEGKAYCKDWEGQQEVTNEMILDAICWLGGDDNSVITKINK